MPTDAALFIVTWFVIIALFLAMGRLAFEVQSLRRTLNQSLRVHGHGVGHTLPSLELSRGLEPFPELLVVAESTCSNCWRVLYELVSADPTTNMALLTREPATEWAEFASNMRIIRDDEQWTRLIHLTPPVLLRLNPLGDVIDIALPIDEKSVVATLRSWQMVTVRSDGVGA